jgi:non-homologous end joining protein Ku
LYHDGYKEIIEAMITSKMKGEVAQVKEKMPKRPGSQEHDIRAKLFYEEYQCNLR